MKIYEINEAETVIDNIDKIAFNDPAGWYVSGGCYEFAIALSKALPDSQIYVADDQEGTEAHAFVKFNGKYFDINGQHDSPADVLSDGEFDIHPPVEFREVADDYLVGFIHNVDMNNVSELVDELRGSTEINEEGYSKDQVTEAAKIVEQMYKKKHEYLHWESDAKPTIRGMVAQLNDPFLMSLTKNLGYFNNYGQKWVDLDPNDIWSDKSEMSTVNDMLYDPQYFKDNKSRTFKKVTMMPHRYAIRAKHGFNSNEPTFKPEAKLVHEYAIQVLDGSKMPLPYLKYELVHDERRGTYTSFGQEGRHRAAVANMLDADTMPVLIIVGLYQPSDEPAQLERYTSKILQDF